MAIWQNQQNTDLDSVHTKFTMIRTQTLEEDLAMKIYQHVQYTACTVPAM